MREGKKKKEGTVGREREGRKDGRRGRWREGRRQPRGCPQPGTRAAPGPSTRLAAWHPAQPTPTGPAVSPAAHGIRLSSVLAGSARHPCPGPGSTVSGCGVVVGWAPLRGSCTSWQSWCTAGQEQAAGAPGRAGPGSTAVAGRPAGPGAGSTRRRRPGTPHPRPAPGSDPAPPPRLGPAPCGPNYTSPPAPRAAAGSREMRALIRALPRRRRCVAAPVAAPPWRSLRHRPAGRHRPPPSLASRSRAAAAMSSRQPDAPGKASPAPALLPSGPARRRRR